MFPVIDHPFASNAQTDNVDVLAQPAKRMGEGFAVQAFDHLWSANTESKIETVTADLSQRQRGHSRHGRRSCRDLHDAGAQPDVLSDRRQVTKR